MLKLMAQYGFASCHVPKSYIGDYGFIFTFLN